MPQVFTNDDQTLCATVKKVNDTIKEINLENGKHSPVFNCDLERSRKGMSQNGRYYLNFSLYADSIHPNPLLAKLWLRRIAAQIKRACYYLIFILFTSCVVLWPYIDINNINILIRVKQLQIHILTLL